MKENSKILGLLGLATKAGKAKSGEFSTEKSVKSGRARLVIVAEDASENTRKMFENMCRYHHVSVSFFGSKEELGRAMGKEMRASLAVEDQNLAQAIGKQMTINGGSEV